jgi:hypothetical protein
MVGRSRGGVLPCWRARPSRSFLAMLGRKQEINLQFSQVLDMLLLLLAFVIAYQVRLSLPGFLFFAEESITEEPSRFYWQVAIIAPFTPLVLEYLGY